MNTTTEIIPTPCPACEVARYLHDHDARIYIDGREHRVVMVADEERPLGASCYGITDEPERWQ